MSRLIKESLAWILVLSNLNIDMQEVWQALQVALVECSQIVDHLKLVRVLLGHEEYWGIEAWCHGPGV